MEPIRGLRALGPSVYLAIATALTACGGSSNGAAATSAALSTAVSNTVTSASTTCVPITQAIPFYGTGVAADAYGDIYGGVIPSNGTYGTLTVGATTSIAGTTFTNLSTTSLGTFQLVLSSNTHSSSYYSSTASVSGSLTIGTSYQEQIEADASSGTYGTASPSVPCVSGMALQGEVYTSGNNGFTGNIYLYLNGTQHGFVASF